MTTPRVLVLMGSGETAPTMIKPHRAIFDAIGVESPKAVMLDTPFGFQENRDILVEKTLQFFSESIGRDVEAAGLTRIEGADPVVVEAGLAKVRQADWVFAGPGSPTYALRQWRQSSLPSLLADKLERGGTLVFSSAAVLTLGVGTVPVYEIYKVGAEPVWEPGLDLLTPLGLPVAVIPHYDNTEGGNHDTRFCYLGETRLRMLESQLDPDQFILGIDEHTAVILDLDANTAEVVGKGALTLRTQGESSRIEAGLTVSIDALRSPDHGRRPSLVTTSDPEREQASAVERQPATGAGGSSLLDDIAKQEASFDAAIDAGDASGAVGAVLALEQAIETWSADTTQNDHKDRARAALRSMISRLGTAAVAGLQDPRQVIEPVVAATLELRRAVRDEKRYDLSDLLRDELAKAGIEVRDTPDGVEWVLQ
ncbi:MAG: hypothetical protein R2733_22990 [Acidimicrobiales bacterium]